ncbi:MAG: ATP-binding cassette domain-containing protein [Bacteriovoracaceae bacterium]|nr:ATP-binding cassette domain-containing protein [Bacteriovoracaceae bacterium]
MAAPQSLLQLSNGYKAYGTQMLFEDATFAINEGEHVGVIGPNGAGKSTLFKILIGSEDLGDGKVIRSHALRLGYLSQHDHWGENETGNDYLERVCTIPVWEAKMAGQDMQIPEEIYEKPILSLSGGYRMRIKLVGLLGMDPNLMLLDEPTNYLDLETTLLLERFLQNYEGAFLLISHDREVLRRTTDHILEIESGAMVKYSGNIDDYFEQKELMRTQLAAKAQSQAQKTKAVMDFVARFGASATKAKQAQSKLKSLKKMEVIEFKPVPIRAAIQIPQPNHTGRTVMTLDNVSFGYPNKTVLKKVSMEIRRGDHVAVVGLNGAGKSTLLKGLAGTIEPLSGKRTLGHQVELAIFNQHVVEVLNPAHSVYESLEEVTDITITPQEIRAMAGSLLFSNDHITKKIKVLSGGEKSRVALGRILLQKVPCILLDEPTNHLDFQTVEALIQALNKYTGTVIVVSHDRGFIGRVGTKILEVTKGEVNVYPGTYDEYVWSLQQRLANNEIEEESSAIEIPKVELPKKNPRKDLSKEIRNLERKIEQCQEKISKLEKENEELNAKIVSGVKNSQEAVKKMSDNGIEIQNLEVEWSSLETSLSELKTN